MGEGGIILPGDNRQIPRNNPGLQCEYILLRPLNQNRKLVERIRIINKNAQPIIPQMNSFIVVVLLGGDYVAFACVQTYGRVEVQKAFGLEDDLQLFEGVVGVGVQGEELGVGRGLEVQLHYLVGEKSVFC